MKNVFAVCLLVNDLKNSRDFYENKLELQVNSQDEGYIDYKLENILLALFEKSQAIAMFPQKHMHNGGACVIAFQTKNVKKTCEKLKQKGIEMFEGPKTTPWGQKVAYFKDPDEHIWEITD